jgi:hypothetical protein
MSQFHTSPDPRGGVCMKAKAKKWKTVARTWNDLPFIVQTDGS